MKLLVLFSWMGRTIIERPLKEVADFLEDPASAIVYDKYITVGWFSNCCLPSNLHLSPLLQKSRHIKVLSDSEAHKDVIGEQIFLKSYMIPYQY